MKTILALMVAVLIGAPAYAASPAPVTARPPLCDPLNLIPGCRNADGTTARPVLTGDPIADLHAAIKKGGAKLIMHLKQTYALGVGAKDNTSSTCAKALVPIVDLVVNGPKPGTLDPTDPMVLTTDETAMAADTSEPDGIPVQIEKIRILRLALNSPSLNDACGALVQDEVKNAQNLVGKITSLITGAGLAGIGL